MRMVAPGLIEQRFHPGMVLDLESLLETKEARERLCEGRPCAVLSILPEGVRTNHTTSGIDYFRSERIKSTITALAVVAHDDVMEAVSKVYFTFYPQGFRIKVFNDEHDALKWLKAQMEEVAREERNG